MIKANRNPYLLVAGVLCALVSPSARANFSKGIRIGATIGVTIGALTALKARQSTINQPKIGQPEMVRVWYSLNNGDPNGTLEYVKKYGLTVSTGTGEHFMYHDFWVKEADGSISSSWFLRPGPRHIGFDVDPQRTKVRNRVWKNWKNMNNESGYRASEQTLLEYMKRQAAVAQMEEKSFLRVEQHPVTADPYYYLNYEWDGAHIPPLPVNGESYPEGPVCCYPEGPVGYYPEGPVGYCNEVIINKHIDPKDLHFYDEQGNETK